MHASTRRHLRLLAWLVFLVIAPLLLAYARGYRLPGGPLQNWIASTRPAVGALVVRTVPRGAVVGVDGAIVDERTPTGVGNLPAGSHLIRIEKPGYRSYEKQLTIEGGRVTDLLFVRLLPNPLDEQVVLGDVRSFWVSPDEQWMVVRDARGLRLRGADADPTDLGVILTPLPARTTTLALDWAPDATAAIVSGPETPPVLGIIDVTNRRWIPLAREAQTIGWTRAGPDRAVLLFPDGRLVGISRETKTSDVLAEGVQTAAIHPRGILLGRSASNGGATLLHLLRPSGRIDPLVPPAPSPLRRVTVSALGGVAAEGTDGRLFVLASDADAWREISARVHRSAWSPDGTKLLFQETEFDLSVVNIAEERGVLPLLQPELVVRVSTPIRSAQWFPDSQHALFIEHDIVRLADLDLRGGHRIENLATTDRGETTLAVIEGGAELLFAARRGERDVIVRAFLRAPADR